MRKPGKLLRGAAQRATSRNDQVDGGQIHPCSKRSIRRSDYIRAFRTVCSRALLALKATYLQAGTSIIFPASLPAIVRISRPARSLTEDVPRFYGDGFLRISPKTAVSGQSTGYRLICGQSAFPPSAPLASRIRRPSWFTRYWLHCCHSQRSLPAT